MLERHSLFKIKSWWNKPKWFRKCQACGCYNAEHYRQNTQYVDEKSNWVTLCSSCSKMNDDYWEERWSEYYSGLL